MSTHWDFPPASGSHDSIASRHPRGSAQRTGSDSISRYRNARVVGGRRHQGGQRALAEVGVGERGVPRVVKRQYLSDHVRPDAPGRLAERLGLLRCGGERAK